MGERLVQSEVMWNEVNGPVLQVNEILRKFVVSGKCWGSILLVEDDNGVRELTSKILEMRGYTVYVAENAEEGISLFQEHKDAIELLVADISMPGMSGQELMSRLRSEREGLKTIFISGCDSSVVEGRLLDANCAYLQKPFTMETLAHKVRELIDGAKYPGENCGSFREM